MGDPSETVVAATSDYFHSPLEQPKWTERKSIYSKYSLAIGFPLPSWFILLGYKNNLEQRESSTVNRNHFVVLDNSCKDSLAVRRRLTPYVSFTRMASALLF